MENNKELKAIDLKQQTLYKFLGNDTFKTIYYRDANKELHEINEADEFYTISVAPTSEKNVLAVDLLIPAKNSKGLMHITNNFEKFIEIEEKK